MWLSKSPSDTNANGKCDHTVRFNFPLEIVGDSYEFDTPLYTTRTPTTVTAAPQSTTIETQTATISPKTASRPHATTELPMTETWRTVTGSLPSTTLEASGSQIRWWIVVICVISFLLLCVVTCVGICYCRKRVNATKLEKELDKTQSSESCSEQTDSTQTTENSEDTENSSPEQKGFGKFPASIIDFGSCSSLSPREESYDPVDTLPFDNKSPKTIASLKTIDRWKRGADMMEVLKRHPKLRFDKREIERWKTGARDLEAMKTHLNWLRSQDPLDETQTSSASRSEKAAMDSTDNDEKGEEEGFTEPENEKAVMKNEENEEEGFAEQPENEKSAVGTPADAQDKKKSLTKSEEAVAVENCPKKNTAVQKKHSVVGYQKPGTEEPVDGNSLIKDTIDKEEIFVDPTARSAEKAKKEEK